MGRRVLVVDDDPRNLQLLADICGRAGYEVDRAGDGVEALERVGACRPDGILLDVMMPRLDGFGVCARLRSEPEHAGIAILMVTALDDASGRLKALEHGADDYVPKPFRAADVLKRLERAIEFRDATNRLASADAAVRAEEVPGLGDYADLRRDLDDAIAVAERQHSGLCCLAIVPEKSNGPNGGRGPWLASHGQTVRASLRDADRVYLLGNEEIVVLMPECESGKLEDAVAHIRDALGAAAEGFAVGGVLHTPGDERLLRRARSAALDGAAVGRSR